MKGALPKAAALINGHTLLCSSQTLWLSFPLVIGNPGRNEHSLWGKSGGIMQLYRTPPPCSGVTNVETMAG